MKAVPSATASLAQRTCKVRKGEAAKLTAAAVSDLLKQVNGWKRTAGEIAKTFKFKNYYETMAFVNATAWVSHQQNHHPDLEVGYNKCRIRYSTHSVGGLSENDFICAARVDQLL